MLRYSSNNLKLKPDWSFQDDAIRNVVNDFRRSPSGKKLLVIPTGGGKTIVALRVVDKLIKNKLLNNDKRIIWVVHTKWLKTQTELKREQNAKKFNFSSDIFNVLEIRMKDDARRILQSSNSNQYTMLIIDEAHHSAAAGYKDFFNPNIGILGLTATPTRTDDLELDFDDISYSISFRDLVNRGVILLPEFKQINTQMTVNVSSIDYYPENSELDKFDFEKRNKFIADIIFNQKNRYQKVIIFVGTNAHVRKLYEVLAMENEFYNNPYKHIGFIYGGDNNELGISNDEYLKKHQKIQSSILVNCKILNEGYDDPSIDTVIMATPSKSILYYMQCIGRVVRNPGVDNKEAKAYVLELIDKLPNVKYRIDNRWLFSEISDYLEPEVIDISYHDKNHLRQIVINLLRQHKVKDKYIDLIPEQIAGSNFNLLLFADEPTISSATWKPLYFSEPDSHKYVTVFNKLSVNIKEYIKSQLNDRFLFYSKLKISENDELFKHSEIRVALISALERANNLKEKRERVDCLKYYTFSEEKYRTLWGKIMYYIVKLIKYIIK